jgi:ribosomal-protein-serine acetyltransferase
VIDVNRPYLRQWLPWLDSTRTEVDTPRFIASSRRQFAEDKEIVAGICYHGMLVGVIGLHGIAPPADVPFIGYWVGQNSQGKGIVTRAVRAMLTHAFGQLQLHRVEIRCAAGNARSQAIPLRLGFTREGTLRQAERLYDRYEDSIVFSMRRGEWLAGPRDT